MTWRQRLKAAFAVRTEEPPKIAPGDEDPCYTLAEARAIFLAQACAESGHTWAFAAGADGRPSLVYCQRGCGTPSGTITYPT